MEEPYYPDIGNASGGYALSSARTNCKRSPIQNPDKNHYINLSENNGDTVPGAGVFFWGGGGGAKMALLGNLDNLHFSMDKAARMFSSFLIQKDKQQCGQKDPRSVLCVVPFRYRDPISI